jgi:predicted DNA-binding antitoxin AbrB/MazE fold protein
MTKEVEAVYEHGMIRPLEPLDLPEGTRLDVIVTHEQTKTNGNAADGKMGQPLMATPAISQGMLIVRGENVIYAIR